MIIFSVYRNKPVLFLQGMDPSIFNACISLLREKKCTYIPRIKAWTFIPYLYESLKDELEDIDEVRFESHQKEQEIQELASPCKPEQELSSREVKPDFSLLNYGPIKGKHPYEDFQVQDITSGLNATRYGFMLGMGTGKSYIISALIAHRWKKWHQVSKVLLITTSIGVWNMYHEIFKFIKDLKEEDVTVVTKDNRDLFNQPGSIFITSYNTFRLICNYYKKELKIKSNIPRKPFLPFSEWLGGKEGMLLLDESHEIAHSTSQRGHYVALHSQYFKYRYLFTGTPADSPDKLYNQFKVLDPWLIQNLSYSQWLPTVANVGNQYSMFAVNSWKEEGVEELNKRFTAHHGIYRNTEDVVELPDHLVKKIYMPMTKEQLFIYQTLVMEDLHANEAVRSIVNKFPFLLLAIDNPFLLIKHEGKFSDRLIQAILKFHDKYMKKWQVIQDVIDDHPNEKGILWCVHPDTITRLAQMYKAYHPITIMGSTKQEERNRLVEEFKKGKSSLLIANINVLNTSLTITEATYQVYVERTYDFIPYEQSTQRIYRIGQKNKVSTYILICDKSLDVLRDKNLSSKGMLVKGLLDKDFLTPDQWKEIFNGSENSDFNYQ